MEYKKLMFVKQTQEEKPTDKSLMNVYKPTFIINNSFKSDQDNSIEV